MASTNAAEVYGFDLDALQPVADRVGHRSTSSSHHRRRPPRRTARSTMRSATSAGRRRGAELFASLLQR